MLDVNYGFSASSAPTRSLFNAKFYAKALAEYAETRASDLAVVLEAINDIEPEHFDDFGAQSQDVIAGSELIEDIHTPTAAEISAYADEIIQSHQLTQCTALSTNTGMIDFPTLLAGCIRTVCSIDEVDEELAQFTVNQGQGSIVSVCSAVSAITDQIASAYGMANCLKSMVNSADVPGRISEFEGRMRQFFSQAGVDGQAVVTYYKQLLLDCTDVEDMIAKLVEDTGSEAQITAEDDPENDLPCWNNGSIADFTGVSPMGCLNFQKTASKVEKIGKAVAVGAKALWSAFKSIGKKVGGWISSVAQTVANVVVDPNDLDTLATIDPNYTISGCCVQSQGSYYSWTGKLLDFPSMGISAIIDAYNNALANKGEEADNVVRFMRTTFGTIAIKVDYSPSTHFNASAGDVGFVNGGVYDANWSANVCPAVINYSAIMGFFKRYQFEEAANYRRVFMTNLMQRDLLRYITEHQAEISDPGSQSELDCWRGQYMSVQLIQNLGKLLRTLDNPSAIPESGFYVYDPSFIKPDGSSVTNRDFLITSALVNPDGSSTYLPGTGDDERYSRDGFYIGLTSLIGLVLMSQLDRYVWPGYNAFVPYSENSTLLGDPKFRIKTDAENGEALAVMLATAITVVVVAVVGVKLACKIKKVKINRAFKREAELARYKRIMNTKNGYKRLTPRQKKRYIRLLKKGGVDKYLSTQLTSSAIATVSDALPQSCSNDDIITTLTGYSI